MNRINEQIDSWNETLDDLLKNNNDINTLRFETLLSITMIKATIADLYRLKYSKENSINA